MRIRLILAIALASISLLLVVALSLSLTRQALSAQQAETERRLQEVALAVGHAVDAHLDQHLHAVRLAARQRGSPPTSETNTTHALMDSFPGLLSALVTNANGTIVGVSARDPAVDTRSLVGQSVADRDYFRAPQESLTAYVSPVFKGRGVGDDWIVAVSAPIAGEAGRFEGIVEASLDLAAIAERVSQNDTLERVPFGIADHQGNVVFRSVHDPSDTIVSSVSATTGHGWVIDLELPESYSRAWRSTRLRQMMLASAIVLIIAFFIAWPLAARITRPLEDLTRIIAAATPGEPIQLTQRVRRAPFEVNRLAQRFQRLTDLLRESLAEERDAYQLMSEARDELAQEVRDREQIIAERTRELASQNRELKRLAAEAQQAAKAKSTFLATMSHELRTPLAAMAGFAQLTEQALGNDRTAVVRDAASSISRNAQRLESTINNILELAALDPNVAHVGTEMVDLPALLRSQITAFKTRAEEADRPIDLRISWSSSSTIESNREGLTSIVSQVLDNAIKFSEAGVIDVRLTSSSDDAWALEIHNEGPVIPAPLLEQVSEPFFQVDQRANRRFSGAGLGLALVRARCEQLGLSLTIQSEEQTGTTVRINMQTGA